MTNRSIIEAHYAASDRGDLDGMLAPLADDVAWTEMAGFPCAGTYRGPRAVAEHVFAALAAEWDGYTVTIDEVLDAGDTIVGVGTYSGTYRATGRAMRARVVHVWRLQAGQVVAFEQFTDTLKVREAMA